MNLYPKQGRTYRWKGQPEVLTYVGLHRDHPHCRGWYQFEKLGEPGVVWCEVRQEDLDSMEELRGEVIKTKSFGPLVSELAAIAVIGAGLSGFGGFVGGAGRTPLTEAEVGGWATSKGPLTEAEMGWPQPPKGPRSKPGNSLAAARIKAKARRKAQQKARRK